MGHVSHSRPRWWRKPSDQTILKAFCLETDFQSPPDTFWPNNFEGLLPGNGLSIPSRHLLTKQFWRPSAWKWRLSFNLLQAPSDQTILKAFCLETDFQSPPDTFWPNNFEGLLPGNGDYLSISSRHLLTKQFWRPSAWKRTFNPLQALESYLLRTSQAKGF